MKRFTRMIFKNFFSIIKLHINSGRIAKKNVMKFEDRIKYVMPYVKRCHRHMRVNINVFGKEYIDSSIKGCLLMGNHQGMQDGISMIQALDVDCPSSFVIADNRSHMFLFGNLCDLAQAKRIKFDDLKDQLRVYKEMESEIIENDRKYIVFPEAGYSDNKNNIMEFNSPCFSPALKSKCPIIPFCLYDTWKIHHKDYQTKDWLDIEIHFLKPIYYEEYKGLNKQKLAQLVRDRVVEKMNELKKQKNEL